MKCVKEIDADKVAIEKKKELLGRKVVEIASDIEFDIVGVTYETEKYKSKILSYPVVVVLSNEKLQKKIELEQFEKKYTLIH